jgi:hypothetical protein
MGFILGLGAVTVIDIHGFLGRKSLYWTKATIQTHKVTKLLIWAGTFLKLLGISAYCYFNGLTTPWTISLLTLFVLVLNGMFLSFYISPLLLKQEKEGVIALLPTRVQNMIFISFIVSFTGWWLNFALITYLLFVNMYV